MLTRHRCMEALLPNPNLESKKSAHLLWLQRCVQGEASREIKRREHSDVHLGPRRHRERFTRATTLAVGSRARPKFASLGWVVWNDFQYQCSALLCLDPERSARPVVI